MIRQGINQAINESPTNGHLATDGMGGRVDVWNEWIDLSIIQKVNRRKNGPIAAPFTVDPTESTNEWVAERSSRCETIQ